MYGTIKNIINNLKNGQNKEFEIFNNKLDMKWFYSFEFIDGGVYMKVNGSTLTGMFFDSLSDLESYLKNTLINDENYQITK